MNSKTGQLICIWSGPVGLAIFGIGLWPLAHFLPPLMPSASADAIAAIYSADTLGIRLGAMLMMLGVSMLAPMFGAITVMLKRIEGENAPYAATQLLSAAIVLTPLMLGALIFTVAAFRPERAPEATQMLNDLGWITLVTPGAPFFVQAMAIGLAILGDKGAAPVMPRWSGYLTLWLAVLALPGALAILFKTGPFAWNGLLAFWLPFGLFSGWGFMMAFLMTNAVKRYKA